MKKIDLNQWRRLVASKDGPASPTTRLLLLTMSLHMDKSGGSCWPLLSTLVEETKLSPRAVKGHMAKAFDQGWIRKECFKADGRGWQRRAYQAAIPDDVVHPMHYETIQRGASDAPAIKRRGARDSKRGARDSKRGARDSSSCIELSKKLSKELSNNTFSSESDELRLAQLLLDLIIGNNPKFKKPDLQKWAQAIDLAIRRDGRSPDDLESVIRWSQKDDFWMTNILSAAKLRDQFDQLFIKMEKDNGKFQGIPGPNQGQGGRTGNSQSKYDAVPTAHFEIR